MDFGHQLEARSDLPRNPDDDHTKNVFGVADSPDGPRVFGLSAVVTVAGGDSANDQLRIRGLGGDDVIDASGFLDSVSLFLEGGLGDDILIGSGEDDVLIGADGNDLALMGAGEDSSASPHR